MSEEIQPKPPFRVPAIADLTPYLSAALFEVRGRTSAQAAVENALSAARDECKHSLGLIAPQRVSGGAWSGALLYVETKRPSWWNGGPEESHHQLLLALAKGRHLALCASDAGFRERIAEKIIADKLATPISRKAMTSAFVGPEAKTAWLNGIHTSSAVKADAKMLSGQALEYTIDPLGDHTYYLSALRSRPEIAGLQTAPAPRGMKSKANRKRTLGAAPGRSRIWLGRPQNWAEFNAQLVALMDHLATGASQVPVGFASLAEEVEGVDSVGKAYAVTLMPASLIDDDVTQSNRDVEDELRTAYEVYFDIVSGSKGGFEADVYMAGDFLGTIAVMLKKQGNAFEITPAWKDAEETEVRTNIKAALGRRNGVKIYYDDGKTYAEGHIFSTKFIEAEFPWKPMNFGGFDVHREKPGAKGEKLIDAIVRQTDNSLFDFVREQWGASGMLACDDGSMELADFLHYDETRQHIELIHVKAAGGSIDPSKVAPKPAKRPRTPKTSGDRQISVSDYEIVAAQAIKNLRHLDKGVLIQRLKKSADNEIAAATWIDGVRVGNRKKLIAALESAPENLSRGVTVLQPRLTMKEIASCKKAPRDSKRAVQFNQLNALMLATAQAVANLGGIFTGIADDEA